MQCIGDIISMKPKQICPSCGSVELDTFYEIFNAPVHSVRLLESREEALNYLTGDIGLGFCNQCGFICNLNFDPGVHEYASGYESTQSYSPTFNSFAYRLAESLVREFNLYTKKVIEIGCGQGEFLELLCRLGGNEGLGFDPAYVPRKFEDVGAGKIEVIRDFYSEAYAHFKADFICCKMTLEHIDKTADFVRTVRRSIQHDDNVAVYFQVPDVLRILKDRAFWDIYYEHCSYFSPGSLSRLFRSCGFDVINLKRGYQDQYLMIEARPTDHVGQFDTALEESVPQLKHLVEDFAIGVLETQGWWRNKIKDLYSRDKKIVIWGGGSKGVAFLSTLDIENEIKFVVDINPKKKGTYMAGTGQMVVLPEYLTEYRPDVVIVMNSIYRADIEKDLNKMELNPEIMTVEHPQEKEIQ